MTLRELKIHDFRNIKCADINLDTQYNIFHGNNGSGKTALLEAIYLLSCGHSFRTKEHKPIINYTTNKVTVFAKTLQDNTISISKTQDGVTEAKINHELCKRKSELAYFMPCQLFYQDIFAIIDAGPSIRRSLLDWGMFHVKHSYHKISQDYTKALKQRNALLKQKASMQDFLPWNKILDELSEEMHKLRLEYFQSLEQEFHSFLTQLSKKHYNIAYYKGWDPENQGISLAESFKISFAKDLARQYTSLGPHNADIILNYDAHKIKQVCSRGQQKIILCALKLAQAKLVNKDCIYLLDDIAAELDQEHLNLLISCLLKVNAQLFLTTTNLKVFSELLEVKSHSYAMQEFTY
jgi:DNA replication and repair protein RecF